MPDPAVVRHRLIEAVLSSAVDNNPQPAADVTGAAVGAFCAELATLVGQRAVRSLYDRSVHLASSRHAWLELIAANPGDEVSADVHRRLRERPADDALAAARTLLIELTGLLASLIGDALTENLMRAAWTQHAQAWPSPENPR